MAAQGHPPVLLPHETFYVRYDLYSLWRRFMVGTPATIRKRYSIIAALQDKLFWLATDPPQGHDA